MAKATFTLEEAATNAADEIEKRVRANDGSFDSAYCRALMRYEFTRWMSEGRNRDLAEAVAGMLSDRIASEEDEPAITVDWYDEATENRRRELIEAQREICEDIDLEKASLESANERKKSAQAAIEEGHTRLRSLARDLAKPFIYVLPTAPERQRDLPIMDGEEWRRVPLAEVLTESVTLKTVVGEKLGKVTLGEYAELAKKFGTSEKPKKLTRKQWDQVEEAVQAWHAKNTPAEV